MDYAEPLSVCDWEIEGLVWQLGLFFLLGWVGMGFGVGAGGDNDSVEKNDGQINLMNGTRDPLTKISRTEII